MESITSPKRILVGIGKKHLKSERQSVIMQVMTKDEKKYWYLFTIIECPVCGATDIFKERQYTPKPANPQDRYNYEQGYDWCEG